MPNGGVEIAEGARRTRFFISRCPLSLISYGIRHVFRFMHNFGLIGRFLVSIFSARDFVHDELERVPMRMTLVLK